MKRFSEYLHERFSEAAYPGKPEEGLGDEDGAIDDSAEDKSIANKASYRYMTKGVTSKYRNIFEKIFEIFAYLVGEQQSYKDFLYFIRSHSNINPRIRMLAEALPDSYDATLGVQIRRIIDQGVRREIDKQYKQWQGGKGKRDKNPYTDVSTVMPLDTQNHPDGKSGGSSMNQ